MFLIISYLSFAKFFEQPSILTLVQFRNFLSLLNGAHVVVVFVAENG